MKYHTKEQWYKRAFEYAKKIYTDSPSQPLSVAGLAVDYLASKCEQMSDSLEAYRANEKRLVEHIEWLGERIDNLED